MPRESRGGCTPRHGVGAEAEGVTKPEHVTTAVLESYQEYLFDFRKPDGASLSGNAQHCRLVPVRGFFRWMVRKDHLPANPAADLDLPRLGRQLPKNVMNATEAQRVFDQPDVRTKTGLRDRAMLEVS